MQALPLVYEKDVVLDGTCFCSHMGMWVQFRLCG